MRALTLDYVKASQARPISLAILATSFVFAGYLAKSYIDLRQEKAHWQSQIARLQEEQRRVQAQDKGSEDQATLKPEITK